GKRYYCDYCCCYIKNDMNIRKLHNAGQSHAMAKTFYMRRFEDPLKVLTEERAKLVCNRYFSNYCKFELTCNLSHYSDHQLQQLEVLAKNKRKRNRNKKKIRRLPPSLEPLQLAKLLQTDWTTKWG
ncbi:CG31922, partial [Drosophila busckii]